MEVRKNTVSQKLEVRSRKENVIARPSKLGRGNLKKKLVAFGCWLLVLSLLVQPALAVTVEVRIEEPTSTIFDGSVDTKQTTINTTDGSTFNIDADVAAAALEAAAKKGGFSTAYIDWSGLFLTNIGNIPKNFSKTDTSNWMYRLNYKTWPFADALAVQKIKSGDNLLFFYASWMDANMPLKLEVANTSLKKNESLSLRTTYFDDATNVFRPILASVNIGNQTLTTDENGQLVTTMSSAGSYQISVSKTGFVRSNKVQVVVGNVVTSQQINDSVNKAQMFLKKRLAKNGRIENPAISAWAAMAFASINIDPNTVMRKKGISKKKQRSLIDYLNNYTKTSLNKKWLKKHPKAAKPLATDYARQIMAVYAAKQNPRNFGGVNLVKELSRFYNNGQFGSISLINDDIFTIIAYRAARVNPKLKPFKDAIRFVKKNQHQDGGFSYSANPSMKSEVDTTAAAIQALVLAKKAGIKNLDNNIDKAYNYLVGSQKSDGGFAYNSQFNQSNIGSTSWASQAIAAYKGGSAVDNLTASSGATPLYFASTLQNIDGGFGYSQGSASDAWNTTQVIPALMKKPWPVSWR